MFNDVCNLVKQTFTLNDVGDEVATETTRQVYCEVQSIGLKRKMEALSAGLKLEFKIKLADKADYQDESIIVYNSARYSVVNVYVTENYQVELTLSKIPVVVST